jgi:branched-chain amino acid transport system ATP-binding protein
MLVTTLDNRNRKLLSIAMELMQNPRLLIIDELSFGLDQQVAKKIIKKIKKISEKLKSSVLLTEQNLSVGLAVTEQVYVINKQSVQESHKLLRIPQDEGLLPFCVL